MAVIHILPSKEKIKYSRLFGESRREDNSFEYLTIQNEVVR
jgi:hypothetical protein